MSKNQFIIYFAFLAGLSLCASATVPHQAWAEAPPSEAGLREHEPNRPQGPIPEEITGTLTLSQALSQALLKNPELKAVSLEVRARESRALQAGLVPNPEVEIEAENFAGQGDLQDFDSAETTIQVSQTIELAGKRSKRRQFASLESDLSGWDYEAKRAELVAGVTKAFVDALAAQERLAVQEEAVLLAEQVLNAVSERVKAGKVSALEKKRAKVSYSRSLIDLERARRSLEAFRSKLAASWGSPSPLFQELGGDLDLIRPIPSVEALAHRTSGNPAIARWSTELEHREAAVSLEESKRVPDVTLNAGVRHLGESDDNAFVMGLSVPLPLFDRNQGGVDEARHRLAKAKQERRVAELNLYKALAEAYQALATAYNEAAALKADVLPQAQAAFEDTREGYRLGKFDFLVMLDARRILFEVRDQYIEALASYHKGVAEMERLIGGPLVHSPDVSD